MGGRLQSGAADIPSLTFFFFFKKKKKLLSYTMKQCDISVSDGQTVIPPIRYVLAVWAGRTAVSVGNAKEPWSLLPTAYPVPILFTLRVANLAINVTRQGSACKRLISSSTTSTTVANLRQ
jgi:hypothetical protein